MQEQPKFVQIAVAPNGHSNNLQSDVYALDEKGEVWRRVWVYGGYNGPGKWEWKPAV